jgi:tetrahydromethanopterin:alpha-L-glutamate ligase
MERFIRIGVVTAWPEDDWHSKRLLAACNRLGQAEPVDPAALSAGIGRLGLTPSSGGLALDFDALILARGMGRAGDPDVQFELYRILEEEGALLVNRLGPLLSAQDKFRTSWLLARAGVPTPPAAVAQTPDDAEAALFALGDAVLKPIAGSLGEGVERVRPDAAGRRAVRRRVARDRGVYLQAYAPHAGADLRAFVVGGETRATIARRAPAGEWRTNLARGGQAEAVDCPVAVSAAAEAAAAALALDYAGVDLVLGPAGPTVIEVNGNPSWQGILEATGLDMAEVIAEHVLGRALRRRGASNHIHVRERIGATHG